MNEPLESKKIKIDIYAPISLSESEIKEIKEVYEKKFHTNDSIVSINVDKTLIAGIKVLVDSIVYDNTVKHKLEQLKDTDKFDNKIDSYEYGVVIELDEEIAFISGLPNCEYGEILIFDDGSRALAMNLERNFIGAIFIDKKSDAKIGSQVKRTGTSAEVFVSDALLGRVIDALGNPIDGKKEINFEKSRPVIFDAPGIMDRKIINRSLKTGILAVDSMIPIGRGQRELIIGDKQTGKTTLAIDAIINQKDKDVVCIYVAIGQKTSTIERIVSLLQKNDALKNTIILAATASDQIAKQYIAPYAGCAIAEYFMYEKHRDVLIVYDDLTKHAVSYRTISLLLRRPPGREAYPGDIFYVHSRLLERASQLNDDLGGGSMTAIPIVETEEGDISAYIPTNIISITDGQIHLDKDLFNSGFRPAVNAGLSVSRVGGSAQSLVMRHASKAIRLTLTQYWDLEAFSEFSTDLDDNSKNRLDKGKKLLEVLKQNKNILLNENDQVIILFIALKDYLSDIPLKNVKDYVNKVINYIKINYKSFYEEIPNIDNSKLKEFDLLLDKYIKEFEEKKNG